MYLRAIISLFILTITVLIGINCSDERIDPPCSTCPETDPALDSAYSYLASERDSMGFREGIDELIHYSIDRDELGWTHIRFQQYYRSIPVYGRTVIVHLDSTLTKISYSGHPVAGIEIDRSPTIRSETAFEIARDDYLTKYGVEPNVTEQNELFVYVWNEVPHLCWRFTIISPNTIEGYDYYVDAHDGTIVYRAPLWYE